MGSVSSKDRHWQLTQLAAIRSLEGQGSYQAAISAVWTLQKDVLSQQLNKAGIRFRSTEEALLAYYQQTERKESSEAIHALYTLAIMVENTPHLPISREKYEQVTHTVMETLSLEIEGEKAFPDWVIEAESVRNAQYDKATEAQEQTKAVTKYLLLLNVLTTILVSLFTTLLTGNEAILKIINGLVIPALYVIAYYILTVHLIEAEKRFASEREIAEELRAITFLAKYYEGKGLRERALRILTEGAIQLPKEPKTEKNISSEPEWASKLPTLERRFLEHIQENTYTEWNAINEHLAYRRKRFRNHIWISAIAFLIPIFWALAKSSAWQFSMAQLFVLIGAGYLVYEKRIIDNLSTRKAELDRQENELNLVKRQESISKAQVAFYFSEYNAVQNRCPQLPKGFWEGSIKPLDIPAKWKKRVAS